MIEQQKKKRKVTVMAAALVLLAAVVIANIYVIRVQASNEAVIRDLTANISQARQQARDIPSPPDDLEQKLDSLKDQLAASKEGFPSSVDRNEVVDYVLNLASACNVSVLPISSDGWSVQNIGQQYNVLSISTAISGTLKNVKTMADRLQNGRYPTLTLTDFALQKSAAGAIGSIEDDSPVTVRMRIGIYTVLPVAGEVSKS